MSMKKLKTSKVVKSNRSVIHVIELLSEKVGKNIKIQLGMKHTKKHQPRSNGNTSRTLCNFRKIRTFIASTILKNSKAQKRNSWK